MKYKKTIFLLITLLLVYFIYYKFNNHKLNYLALGDSFALGENPYGELTYGYSDFVANYLESKNKLNNYTKDFADSTARTSDLYKDIIINKRVKINGKIANLKKALTDSDIVTISIGANDIINTINQKPEITLSDNKIKEILNKNVNDLNQMIKEIKKYNRGKLILVGYYNLFIYKEDNYKIFKQLNNKYKQYCQNNNLVYIDVYNKISKENIPNPLNIHPSTSGYEIIAKQINKNIN